MRTVAIILLCLFPCASFAAKIANCDSKSYDVTIVNSGTTRVQTLAPHDGAIEEFGPVVSFQIEGHKPMVATEPGDEFCIWSGVIKIQRRNPGNDENGGISLR